MAIPGRAYKMAGANQEAPVKDDDAIAGERTASRAVAELRFRNGQPRDDTRLLAEEVPVALSYGGSTQAVMMASPADLTDFAYGFSLTEGLVATAAEIEAVAIVEASPGFDVQISLIDAREDARRARRRSMAGPVGCGLCGIESIDQALRPLPALTDRPFTLSPDEIAEAVAALSAAQALNHRTHAVHAAGFWQPGTGMVAVREDVGRHNALDKLIGALMRAGTDGACGAIVVTSRLSVEMVQKTAILGAPVLVAVSAPTVLAVKTAEAAGMTLVAVARGTDFECFTRPDRLFPDASPRPEPAGAPAGIA